MEKPTQDLDHANEKKGFFFAISAFLIWGFFPFYLKLFSFSSSLEIVAHRIIWAMPFCLILLFFLKGLSGLKNIFTDKKNLVGILISTILIATNWLVFVYAVNNDKILESSLGYFLNPLLNIFFGMFFFKEKMSKLQWGAFIFATIGVFILTISTNKIPYITLFLAFSFCFYGIVRKKINVSPLAGLFYETLIISPLCLIYIIYLTKIGVGTFTISNLPHMILFISSGVVTALPLYFFALGVKNLPYSTVGFLQFLAPSIQFITGIIYGEVFTQAHIICFIFIFIGVFLFCTNLYVKNRQLKKIIGVNINN